MGWIVILARLAAAVGAAAGVVGKVVDRLRAGPTQAGMAAEAARRQTDKATRDAAATARYEAQRKSQDAREAGDASMPTRAPNSRPGQP